MNIRSRIYGRGRHHWVIVSRKENAGDPLPGSRTVHCTFCGAECYLSPGTADSAARMARDGAETLYACDGCSGLM